MAFFEATEQPMVTPEHGAGFAFIVEAGFSKGSQRGKYICHPPNGTSYCPADHPRKFEFTSYLYILNFDKPWVTESGPVAGQQRPLDEDELSDNETMGSVQKRVC